MRPIDADALKEQLEDWLKQIQGYTSDEHEITRDVLMSVIHSYIADMPTLDVQPVRRGEWEICWGGVLCCTVCGKSADDFIGGLEGANYIEEPYFCPHCGADLRKGEHHE